MSNKNKRVIIRRRDGDWVGLSYNDDGWYKRNEVLKLGLATAQEYAVLCDEDAEQRNHHDFCGVHMKLLEILRVKTSPSIMREIMKEIAEGGGLHGMKVWGE